MNLFGLTFEQAGTNFQISDREKDWVEEVLYYLLEIFGLPEDDAKLVLLNTDFFPLSLPSTEANIKEVIQELCILLKLDASSISDAEFEEARQEEAYKDLMLPFEIDTQFEKEGPKIIYAKALCARPKKLIFLVLYELLQIRLLKSNLELKPKENIGPFTAFAAVFLGFGILAGRNLYSVGSVNQQYWESKWVRPQVMREECMAYMLALWARMRGEENPTWSVLLPKELQDVFREALGYAATRPIPFEKGIKFHIISYLEKSSSLYRKKDYKGAIQTLEALIAKYPDDPLPARVYGNLGYYLTMLGEYEKSLPYFEQALELNPDLRFVHDNLGYAYLRLGELKKGKKYVSASLKGMKNDIAYSFRNLAVYHQAKGEPTKAEEFFDLSYENNTQGVDLLDYHYGEFLLEIGKKKKGMKYLQKSAEEGEPMALQKLEKIPKEKK